MSDANFEDGQRASVAVQTTIFELLDQDLDPCSISLATTSIGAAMLINHYGKINGIEIVIGLLQYAIDGKLEINLALKVANQNAKDPR